VCQPKMGPGGVLSVNTVEFRSKSVGYTAFVDAGLLDRAGSLVASTLRLRCCAVVTDKTIAGLWGKRLLCSLTTSDFEPHLIAIPAGEQSKNLEQVGAICDKMTAAGLDRQAFVIGLGGGVVGDISGFVAAIFQRGIPHVQIPTTLLAMVDSSIGGKTGVNTNSGKNLIGAVNHPVLVLDDLDVLQTLPAREYNQGFAEIIKHGVIADAYMFDDLNPVPASDAVALQQLVTRNIGIKAAVVARDEQDRSGERAILNFGHTVGHAIERAGDYRTFLHGEAISLGMIAAANVSVKRAGLAPAERDAIVDRIAHFKLPTKLPSGFRQEKILAALQFDKKFESGQVRFVVAPKIGSAYLSKDVTLKDIEEAVEQL
jgi:3-dehydroquinate synthase